MLTGVIEGFYGPPWTQAQRLETLQWLEDAGLNCFVYAPKDDLHIRAYWRVPYRPDKLEALAALRAACAEKDIAFAVAIAPCLDIVYSDPGDRAALLARLDQLIEIGVRDIALLFDDIPNALPQADTGKFSSFAAAQSEVANAVQAHLDAHGGGRVLFCPTEYCSRFARDDIEGSEYLDTLGRNLDSAIEIFWTGPDIVSDTITADHIRAVAGVLRRKPLIWENFHANDYDARRVILGPLAGRESSIRDEIAGFITNPNTEWPTNYPAVAFTGAFLNQPDYEPETAARAVLDSWQCRFAIAFQDGECLPQADLALLMDFYYHPFTLGPETGKAIATAKQMLASHRPDATSARWREGLARLRDLRTRTMGLFERLTRLEDRDLFAALHPYALEAQDQIIHLVAYLEWLDQSPDAAQSFPPERIDSFYRRGFAAAIEELLRRDSSGTYFHEL